MGWLGKVLEQNPWLLFATLPAIIAIVWYRVRMSAFRLSKQRMQRLYELTRNGKWRNADPLARQIAVADAFRCTLDDRWIEMAFSRHNPMRMLNDCKYALGVVRLTSDGLCFVDNRTLPWPGLRATAWLLYFISIAPWIAASIVSLTPVASPGLLIGLVIVGLIYTPVFTWLGVCVEGARRLKDQLNDRYPVILQEVSSPAPGEKMMKKTAKRKKPTLSTAQEKSEIQAASSK